MKVRCIKTSGYILTRGKIYDVDSYENKVFGEEYLIINDKGVEHTVEKYLFEDVNILRNKKLERLGI
jgi:cytochrome b involved in lipid metabolism